MGMFLAVLSSNATTVDMEKDLMANWDFPDEKGRVLIDRTGHGVNGQLESPEWVSVGRLHMLRFRQDGPASVCVPHFAKPGMSGSFTMIAWFSLPQPARGGWQHILYKKDDFALRELDGKMTFANWNKENGKHNYFYFSHGIFGDNRLHQVAIVYDKVRGCLEMYLDGVIKKKHSKIGLELKNNDSPLQIGWSDGFSASMFFAGCRFYDVALSEKDIVDDCKARKEFCDVFAEKLKNEKRIVVLNPAQKTDSPFWNMLPGCVETNAPGEFSGQNTRLKYVESGKDAKGNVFLRSKTLVGKRVYQLDFDYLFSPANPDSVFQLRFEITPPYKNAAEYYRKVPDEASSVADMDLARQFKMLGGQFSVSTLPPGKPGEVMHKCIQFEIDHASKRQMAFALRGKSTVILDNVTLTEILPVALPLDAPMPQCPIDGSEISDFALDFVWKNSGDAIKYEIEIARTTNFLGAKKYGVDDNGVSEGYFRPSDNFSSGEWHWRVRGINEYGQVSDWSDVKRYRLCGSNKIIPPSPVISENSPLFVLNWRLRAPIGNLKKIWESIPADLRQFCCLYVLFDRDYREYSTFAKHANEFGIPFFTLDRLMFKYDFGNALALTPLSLKELSYQRDAGLLGSVTVEQSVCNPEVIDYNVRLIKLAAKYGRRAVHIDFGPHVALRLGDEWEQAQACYSRHAVPVLKGVFYSCDGHSSGFGWWLTHKDAVWGIQPEAWYFHQSGYEKLNVPPLRHIGDIGRWNRENNSRAFDVLHSFPATFWGIFMVTGMISGGTVYPFELNHDPEKYGGDTNGFWHLDGTPTKTWTHVVRPLLEDMVKYKLVPSREEIERKVKCAYVIDKGDVPMMDKTIGSVTTESGPLQAFMDVVYGKHYWCDVIPKTSRYYYVPIVFEGDAQGLPREICRMSARDLKSGEDIKGVLDRHYPPATTGSAFVAQVGAVTAVINSNENSDIYEDYGFRVDASCVKKITGIVGVHQYLVAKTLDDKSVFVHLNNRAERNSTIEFECSAKPALKVVPETALVDSRWDEVGKVKTVVVNHKDGAVRLFLNDGISR